ncbi:hypothetical protein BKK81_08935 [Cupriavidus sp. USMAHM13]|uniref:PrpF domain-containing protein n=1 Tax=Cupriavidus sp. USMAHM13 TaxID=1389192 RepID=UPI0008A66BD1|nr:PrpF domain-containing protein [Cupriavidus sp. USMAHM13]AOY99374.1 hypothetical protein BKK81_08935 [Cupriavidus sp. USMAHM13]
MTEIPAFYMRSGAGKGVFLLEDDLPQDGAARDALLLRLLAAPGVAAGDADGLEGRVALMRAARRAGCDVECRIGAVATQVARMDWSGEDSGEEAGGPAAELPAAAGAFAIWRGFVPARDGITTVRIWLRNTGRVVLAHVPCTNGHPLEPCSAHEGGGGDGAADPAATIELDYFAPAAPPPAAAVRRVTVRSGARRLLSGLVHVPERC